MYKGYVGPQKIKSAELSKALTPGGNNLVNFKFEDGTASSIPKVLADRIVTEKATDASSLRDARVQPMCEEILKVLLEHGMKLAEKDYVYATIERSLNASFEIAEGRMWGTDEKTLLDIQDVLDGKKVTLDDLRKEAGDK